MKLNSVNQNFCGKIRLSSPYGPKTFDVDAKQIKHIELTDGTGCGYNRFKYLRNGEEYEAILSGMKNDSNKVGQTFLAMYNAALLAPYDVIIENPHIRCGAAKCE